jgi:8-oxo-dGTP pyrophosphatase MutT (NUDIX family)
MIKHRHHESGQAYWVIPGGGIEAHEAETDCVIREAREETNLEVAVDRLLLEGPVHAEGGYKWLKTYLCRPIGGVASPGFEPEVEAAELYAITEVRWFDLRDESDWDASLINDPFTYPTLREARKKLGYLRSESEIG